MIALSGYSDRRFPTEMLKAGASGYIPKESAFDELEKALDAVTAGRVYLSPSVSGGVVEDVTGGDGGETAFSRLSPREREVLQLLAEGKATKEVARHLHVSVKTVETHRKNLMGKLDLQSVAELTKYALREGLTALGA